MTPADNEAPDAESSPRLSVLAQIGVALGGAALASIACTGHAAVRLTSAGASWPVAWLALASTAFIPAFVLLLALPRAIAVVSAFDPASSRTRWTAIFLWIAIMEMVTWVLGKFLRQSTHHHALAGATYAVLAVVLAVGVGVFAARVASLVARLGEQVIRVAVVLTALVAVGALAFLARALGDTARLTLIDAAAFVAAVGLAARASQVTDAKIGYVGGPLAIVLFVVGAWFLRAPGDVLASAVDALVPLYGKPALFLIGR
jgi:hypothetical protein